MFKRKPVAPDRGPSRAERRRAARQAEKHPPAAGVDLVLPDPGEATFRNGWVLPWKVLLENLRRPFAQLPLLTATLVVFTLAKMTAIYLMGVAIWGLERPDPAVERWANMGLWQMGSWFFGPAALLPWFTAALMFSNGFRSRWRVVTEAVESRRRVLALVFLGTVSLVFAGSFGALGATLSEEVGLLPVIGGGLLFLWAGQVTVMIACAGVWREGWSGRLALWEAFRGWRYAWKSIIAATLSTAIIAIMLVGLLVATLIGPAFALNLPSQQTMWMGFLALPVIFVMWGWWLNAKARLALAFFDWGDPTVESQDV